MPTAVAIQCVEVTTPNVPSISGRVVNGFGLRKFMGFPGLGRRRNDLTTDHGPGQRPLPVPAPPHHTRLISRILRRLPVLAACERSCRPADAQSAPRLPTAARTAPQRGVAREAAQHLTGALTQVAPGQWCVDLAAASTAGAWSITLAHISTVSMTSRI